MVCICMKTRPTITMIKVYADEARTQILENITLTERNQFIATVNTLKEKYANLNLGTVPVWCREGEKTFPDIALSNLVADARFMEKRKK